MTPRPVRRKKKKKRKKSCHFDGYLAAPPRAGLYAYLALRCCDAHKLYIVMNDDNMMTAGMCVDDAW